VIVGGGSGKVNAGTVDPIYNINGEKYATYLPGMTGVKEETTGVAQLACSGQRAACSYVIDFSKVEQGSDLWLFWQVTDFGKDWNNLAVLLTPSFDGRVWYEKKPGEKKLIIYGQPYSLLPTPYSLEFSYRLTAPRFDHEKWSNLSADNIQGFTIERSKNE